MKRDLGLLRFAVSNLFAWFYYHTNYSQLLFMYNIKIDVK